jgi:hypothetical protein
MPAMTASRHTLPRPLPPTSPLGRVVRSGPAAPEDVDRLARAAWRARGVALIDPARLADPWEAQVIRNVATRLFGRREDGQ